MEDLYLNVTLAALQDRENGIKTFAKKSVLSKKVKHCFYGAQFTETMRLFGIDDKAKALEIGQRLYDANYIAPFEAKDRSQGLQEGCVYFWSEVVVMERPVIENNFGLALNYFLEHPYRRQHSATTAPSMDEALSKAGGGLLKRLRGLVDESSPSTPAPTPVPAPAPSPTTAGRRLGNSQSGYSTTSPVANTPAPTPVPAPAAEQVATPDTVEEDTDEIKFFLSPDDPNPVVKAATLEKLIERLTYEAYIDMRFRQQFLITYRSFTTPMTLLEKLRERFRSCSGTPPADATERVEWERHRKLIHLRVLTVLSRWLTDLVEDWHDTELRQALLSFLDEVQPTTVAALGNQLRALLNRQLPDPDRPFTVDAVPGGPPTFSFEDAAVPDMAQQLTSYEFQLFLQLTRDEFLGLKWSKPSKNERAKNVLRFINHFNRLSNWVVREIITCFQQSKRSKVLLKFVQLAVKFREYNNFSSSMCILAALVSSPVRRLKATWAEIPTEWQEKMSALETLFAHNMSYKAYRDAIVKIVPPCIPYLGLYLTDLTFIEEANPDKVDGHLINFQKQIMISKVIEDIRRFQSVPYKNFTVTTAVKNWLGSLPTFSHDEEAYQLSLKIEPRNAAVTLESMLVEEDRLRKQLHQCEIRISDLESENRRLKEQLALLDADLRTQIRRGTDADETAFDGSVIRRTTGTRSIGRLTLQINPNAKAAHDAAAAAQAAGEPATPGPTAEPLGIQKQRALNESGKGTPHESPKGALNESSKGEPLTRVPSTRGRESAVGSPAIVKDLSSSGVYLSRDSSSGGGSTSKESSTNKDAQIPPRTVSPPPSPELPTSTSSGAVAGTSSTGISPTGTSPTAVPPLAMTTSGLTATAPPSPSRSGQQQEPTSPHSPRGPGKVLPASPRSRPAPISPRERPPPIPPFDFPPPTIDPPLPPQSSPRSEPAASSTETPPADSPHKTLADSLDKPGNRLGRIVKRQEMSPTPGSGPIVAPNPVATTAATVIPIAVAHPSSSTLSQSQRNASQVSPAVVGKKLPPVPLKKFPSTAAPSPSSSPSPTPGSSQP